MTKQEQPVYGWWPLPGEPSPTAEQIDPYSKLYCPECEDKVPTASATLRPVALKPPNRRCNDRYPDWFYYCGECGYPVAHLIDGYYGLAIEMPQAQGVHLPAQSDVTGQSQSVTVSQLKAQYDYVASIQSREKIWNPPPVQQQSGWFADWFAQKPPEKPSRYPMPSESPVAPNHANQMPLQDYNQSSSYGYNEKQLVPPIIPWDDPPPNAGFYQGFRRVIGRLNPFKQSPNPGQGRGRR